MYQAPWLDGAVNHNAEREQAEKRLAHAMTCELIGHLPPGGTMAPDDRRRAGAACARIAAEEIAKACRQSHLRIIDGLKEGDPRGHIVLDIRIPWQLVAQPEPKEEA